MTMHKLMNIPLVLRVKIVQVFIVLSVPLCEVILQLLQLSKGCILVGLSVLIQLSQGCGVRLLERIIGLLQFLHFVSVLLVCGVHFCSHFLHFFLVAYFLFVR